MIYNSVNNQKIKNLAKLKNKKYRDKNMVFLVEGKHLVKEAYDSGFLKEMYVLENTDFKLDIKTHYINETVLKYLSSVDSPAGVIGLCEMRTEFALGDRILILDDIQDPGNLGTIIRSSVAFGIDIIVLSEKCADPYSDKVIRASQGMIFKTKITKKDLSVYVKTLKGKMKIYGTKVTDGKVLKTIEKSEKFAIIMGNEGSGVSEELLELCDENIYIPMKNCESLNVGVATGIILYEFAR